jgi:2-polyprenyl-3-methyl-5-hydroxy-6-metoxy-1,4-benzoquinol methylase
MSQTISEKTNLVDLYENFHADTSISKSIVKETDFAMKNHIPMYNKYLKSELKILDVGCGGGTLSLYMASKGANVTGIDISTKAIETNKLSAKYHRFENLKYQKTTIEDFESENNSMYPMIFLQYKKFKLC